MASVAWISTFDGTAPVITEEGEDDGLTRTVAGTAGTVCGLPVALRIEDLI